MLRMYDLVSFVTRGKVRIKVLENLSKAYTPTELASVIKTHRSTTSRAILALEKKGLVDCITPDEKKGRFYHISKQGRKVLNLIKER